VYPDAVARPDGFDGALSTDDLLAELAGRFHLSPTSKWVYLDYIPD
jgi:hypothetical protein